MANDSQKVNLNSTVPAAPARMRNALINTSGPYTDADGMTTQDVSISCYAVPPGGTTGQVLVKLSNADGDVGWADPPAVITPPPPPPTPTPVPVPVSVSALQVVDSYELLWAAPTGFTGGYNAQWQFSGDSTWASATPSGTMIDVPNLRYGATIVGRVRCVDGSGNVSDWVQADPLTLIDPNGGLS